VKQSWRNRTVLIVLSLLGAAAPLAQAVRVVEEQATENAPPRYKLLVGRADSHTETPSASKETDSKRSPPRLIKLITDHWDVTGNVEVSVSDIPAPPATLAFEIPLQPHCNFAHQLPLAAGPPLVPASRGPPTPHA